MAGGGEIYTVGRVASGAIAASVMGVLGQHIDNLDASAFQHFPNMAMALPNLVPLTHRLGLHPSSSPFFLVSNGVVVPAPCYQISPRLKNFQ
jgi:hypothetical protein